jgi:acyl-CoA thioesterase
MNEVVEKRLAMLSSGPVWEYLGIQLIKGENGDSEVHMKTKKEFTQLHGSVHGGLLATVIDASMAAAVNSLLEAHEFTVTAEMKVNYLSPANVTSDKSPLLIGKGHVIKRGRTLILVESQLFDDQDKLLCHAVATFYVFEKK